MPNTQEKIPQKGQYVSMQGGKTPVEQAKIFQLPVEVTENSMFEQLQAFLVVLENQLPELDSGLMAQAWLSLTEIENEAMMRDSAQTVRDAFGEVEAEDRNHLPLVTVYFALLHNSLEAQWREKNECYLVLEWLSEVETLLEKNTKELEQKLITRETQLAQDKKASHDYQRGVMLSYAEASHEGKKGLWQHNQVITEENKELELIKDEMDRLTELELSLSGYRSLMIKAINQPLQTNLN